MNRVEKKISIEVGDFRKDLAHYKRKYVKGDLSQEEALRLAEMGERHIVGRIDRFAPRLKGLKKNVETFYQMERLNILYGEEIQ